MHRGSEKMKSKRSCPKNSRENTGTEKMSTATIAAVTVECSAFASPRVRCFVMSLETVRGMPEEVTVTSTAKTDRAS